MKTKLSFISAALTGVIFGVLANYSSLNGSWLNLIVWAVVGMLIGAFIEDKRYVRWSGISYGVFLTLSFLISGFHGTSENIPGFALLSIVLGIIGAFCGWLTVYLGHWMKHKLLR